MKKITLPALFAFVSITAHAENRAAIAMYNGAVAPRVDSYGNVLPSEAELCRQAREHGGVITQRCAWISQAASYLGKADPTGARVVDAKPTAEDQTADALAPRVRFQGINVGNIAATYRVGGSPQSYLILTNVVCPDKALSDRATFGVGKSYVAVSRAWLGKGEDRGEIMGCFTLNIENSFTKEFNDRYCVARTSG